MVSNPDLVFYTCIARGTVILADFNREPNLDDLASRCIEKAPPNHSIFSHTVRKRAYTFLIEGPFVYFGIFHEDLFKSEICGFLRRLKRVFEEFFESLNGFEDFTSHCFQLQLDSTFRQLLGSNLSKTPSSVSQRSSVDSSKRSKQKIPLISKFSNPGILMKKKKKAVGDGSNGEGGKYATTTMNDDSADVYDDNNGLGSRDVTLLMQKNGSHERQKAKQIWRKHVWIVLSIDLFVCLVLFAIWLWVCRGFKCIDS